MTEQDSRAACDRALKSLKGSVLMELAAPIETELRRLRGLEQRLAFIDEMFARLQSRELTEEDLTYSAPQPLRKNAS